MDLERHSQCSLAAFLSDTAARSADAAQNQRTRPHRRIGIPNSQARHDLQSFLGLSLVVEGEGVRGDRDRVTGIFIEEIAGRPVGLFGIDIEKQ